LLLPRLQLFTRTSFALHSGKVISRRKSELYVFVLLGQRLRLHLSFLPTSTSFYQQASSPLASDAADCNRSLFTVAEPFTMHDYCNSYYSINCLRSLKPPMPRPNVLPYTFITAPLTSTLAHLTLGHSCLLPRPVLPPDPEYHLQLRSISCALSEGHLFNPMPGRFARCKEIFFHVVPRHSCCL